MTKKANIGIFFVILSIIMLISCESVKSNMIDRPGSYRSPRGQLGLVVEVDKNGIVAYTVIRDVTREELVSGDCGSTYQRWFFFWESDQRLWICSSDLGTLVIVEFDKLFNVVTKKSLKRRDPELKAIPAAVRDRLSTTMAKRLGV